MPRRPGVQFVCHAGAESAEGGQLLALDQRGGALGDFPLQLMLVLRGELLCFTAIADVTEKRVGCHELTVAEPPSGVAFDGELPAVLGDEGDLDRVEGLATHYLADQHGAVIVVGLGNDVEQGDVGQLLG